MLKIKYIKSHVEKFKIWKGKEKTITVYRYNKFGSVLFDVLNMYKEPYKRYINKIKKKGNVYENPITVWKFNDKEVEDLKVLLFRYASSSYYIVDKFLVLDQIDHAFRDLGKDEKVEYKQHVDALMINVEYYANVYHMSRLFKKERYRDILIRDNLLLQTFDDDVENRIVIYGSKIDYIINNKKNLFYLKVNGYNEPIKFKIDEKIILPGDVYKTRDGKRIGMPITKEKVLHIRGEEEIEWKKYKISTIPFEEDNQIMIFLNDNFIAKMRKEECRKIMRDLVLCWK